VPLAGFSPSVLPSAGLAPATGAACCQPRWETETERMPLQGVWPSQQNATAGFHSTLALLPSACGCGEVAAGCRTVKEN